MTPTSVLLEALERFLLEDAAPQLSGYSAYQNRIAVNLLQMLRREQRLGSLLRELDARAATELALNGLSPPLLARCLRDGETTDSPALRDYLRERSLLSLAVDNPRYSGCRQGRERWPEIAARIDARAGDSDVGA